MSTRPLIQDPTSPQAPVVFPATGALLLMCVNFMPWSAAENLRTPPRRHLCEFGAAEERLECFLVLPLAEDQIAADRLHIDIQMRFEVAFDGLQMLDHRLEAVLKFLLLPPNHVVMHADGGGHCWIVREKMKNEE